MPKGDVRDLARGDLLFSQGDPATAIFRLVSGRLRLERNTFDGRLVALHVARRGEFFAEAALFSDIYHCDAAALEPCRVERYSKAAMLTAIRSGAGAEALLALLARNLQDTRRRLELRNVRSVRERLLLWMDLAADSERFVPVPGALQDIAAELGMTREALYRALAALEGAGLIERSPTGFRLMSRQDA